MATLRESSCVSEHIDAWLRGPDPVNPWIARGLVLSFQVKRFGVIGRVDVIFLVRSADISTFVVEPTEQKRSMYTFF